MTMRSANVMESSICDPPKPRLTTLWPGKSRASVFQSRTLELPTNRVALRGGGLVLSAASKALISASHFAGPTSVETAGFWASELAVSADSNASAEPRLLGNVRVTMGKLCRKDGQLKVHCLRWFFLFPSVI